MVRAVSPVHADEILRDLRRTHAQLRNAGKTALGRDITPSGWSMRLTLEEVDVLLAIVDERDDLKRRLLGDWEPDIEPIEYARIYHDEGGNPQPRMVSKADYDAHRPDGHRADGSPYWNYQRATRRGASEWKAEARRIEPEWRDATPKRRPRFTYAEGCPRRDTIHDCPLGGCADASPREGEIRDAPKPCAGCGHTLHTLNGGPETGVCGVILSDVAGEVTLPHSWLICERSTFFEHARHCPKSPA